MSSLFILNAVIKTHLESSPSAVAQDLQQNIYVDTLVCGTNNTRQAVNYCEQSVNILSDSGFNLRLWATNNPELQQRIQTNNNHDNAKVINILGMKWNPEADTLCYPTTDQNTTRVHTKREVVKATSSLFDPLGYLAPVHIKAKIFIQQLWKLNP